MKFKVTREKFKEAMTQYEEWAKEEAMNRGIKMPEIELEGEAIDIKKMIRNPNPKPSDEDNIQDFMFDKINEIIDKVNKQKHE